MTKQKQASTNKLTITYINGKTYTILRVEEFQVSTNGKSVTGKYSKEEVVDAMSSIHDITFELNLEDITHLEYRAKQGEVSYDYTVLNGRITSQTEYRGDSYYEQENKPKREISSYLLYQKPWG